MEKYVAGITFRTEADDETIGLDTATYATLDEAREWLDAYPSQHPDTRIASATIAHVTPGRVREVRYEKDE